MLTRSQVARRLNKSVATVRRLEGWKLHPRLDEKGIHRFDAEEVARLSLGMSPQGKHGGPETQVGAHDTYVHENQSPKPMISFGSEPADRANNPDRAHECPGYLYPPCDRRPESACAPDQHERVAATAELLEQLLTLSERELRRLDLDAVWELVEWLDDTTGET